MNRFISWLKNIRITTRSKISNEIETACRKLNIKKSSIRKYYAHKKEKETKELIEQLNQIISKAVRIDFRHEPMNRYGILVQFDPRVVGSFYSSDVLRLMAKCVANQVEAEIASARFIKLADDLEKDRLGISG